MGNLFEGADLSGINREADLVVSDVFHKATVDVNEQGSEFAAATGAVIGLESCRMSDQFKADRPFLYMIKDNESGAVLCTGRMTNP
jgi:serpin B